MRRENDERVKTKLRRKDLLLHSEGCIGKGIQHSVGASLLTFSSSHRCIHERGASSIID